MAVTTKQKGIAVKIETRPTFAGYINTDFPESTKFRERDGIVGEEGKVVTELGNDQTQEVSAKLVQLSATAESPQLFDVLTEDGEGGRAWLVEEISRPREAGKKLLFDLKLKASEGVDLTE